MSILFWGLAAFSALMTFNDMKTGGGAIGAILTGCMVSIALATGEMTW